MKRTTKIVHVIIGMGRGGAETMLRRLIEAQLKEDDRYEHVVISMTDLGVHGAALKSQGIDVRALEMRGFWSAPRVAFSLYRTIRNCSPDIVQTWMYHADLVGGWAAKIAGVPVLWGIHSFDLRAGSSPLTRIVQKLCAWSSYLVPSRILSVAEASRRVHVECGYDPSRFVVIPNGFDIQVPHFPEQTILEMRAKLNVQAQNLLIGCVGRFNAAKDHENFVYAAALVAQKYPEARFLMVGTQLTDQNQLLTNWIKSSGCPSDRFILLGERDDVPLLLSCMDIFCSSSRTEAFPLVVGEAMLMERAAIVTDVGDTSTLVGNAARVVPPRDSQALANGIISLIELGPEGRSRLGQDAKRRVVNEFSMSKLVKRTKTVYEAVLTRN